MSLNGGLEEFCNNCLVDTFLKYNEIKKEFEKKNDLFLNMGKEQLNLKELLKFKGYK